MTQTVDGLDGEIILYQGKLAFLVMLEDTVIYWCDDDGNWHKRSDVGADYISVGNVTLEIEYTSEKHFINHIEYHGCVDEVLHA